MGFDLRPRNKSADDFSMGAFSWSWMLENGVGLPVGHGGGFSAGQFLYRTRPDGKCLAHNDGARVSAKEAKQMAQVALWLCGYQDSLFAEWEKIDEAERTRMQECRSGLYKSPVRRDFVDKIRAFAAWAPTSGGFRVY